MSMAELLRQALSPVKKMDAVFDSSSGDGDEGGLSRLAVSTIDGISVQAITGLHIWVQTDDLEDGETDADRLMAIMVGIADMNQDGELTDDENGILSIALNEVFDYLVANRVSEDDASALLNDWDNDVAMRVKELLSASLPVGEEAMDQDINEFVSSDGDIVMDTAVYKKRVVIRDGQKMRVNRRISGHVKLSSKQRVAIQKMHLKSHSSAARMHRMRSMNIRKRTGL